MWLTYLQIIGSLLFIQRPDYIQNSYFFDKPFHNAFCRGILICGNECPIETSYSQPPMAGNLRRKRQQRSEDITYLDAGNFVSPLEEIGKQQKGF